MDARKNIIVQAVNDSQVLDYLDSEENSASMIWVPFKRGRLGYRLEVKMHSRPSYKLTAIASFAAIHPRQLHPG